MSHFVQIEALTIYPVPFGLDHRIPIRFTIGTRHSPDFGKQPVPLNN